MKSNFVDTGAWIAMAVQRDQFHAPASAYARQLVENRTTLLTTNYVLTETYTRIRYDDGHDAALAFDDKIQKLLVGRQLRLAWVTSLLHARALEIFRKYSDQEFSLVDCSSFAVARQFGVRDVFGFDGSFRTMGFVLKPILPN